HSRAHREPAKSDAAIPLAASRPIETAAFPAAAATGRQPQCRKAKGRRAPGTTRVRSSKSCAQKPLAKIDLLRLTCGVKTKGLAQRSRRMRKGRRRKFHAEPRRRGAPRSTTEARSRQKKCICAHSRATHSS